MLSSRFMRSVPPTDTSLSPITNVTFTLLVSAVSDRLIVFMRVTTVASAGVVADGNVSSPPAVTLRVLRQPASATVIRSIIQMR